MSCLLIFSTEKRESISAFSLPTAFESESSISLILDLEYWVTETEDYFEPQPSRGMDSHLIT